MRFLYKLDLRLSICFLYQNSKRIAIIIKMESLKNCIFQTSANFIIETLFYVQCSLFINILQKNSNLEHSKSNTFTKIQDV